MDELDKGLAISLRGTAAEEALERCRKVLAAWQVAMPDVQPLVLDFGLGDFAGTGLIEYWIANEAEAGYCGKYLFVFEGQTCPLHRHARKMETFFVVKGRLLVNYGERQLVLNEGDVLPVQPGHFHSFTGEGGPALLLELSMPCQVQDNDFADERIPIGR